MDIFQLRNGRRPNILSQRAQWNASWENDLKKVYDNLPRQLPGLASMLSAGGQPFSYELKQATVRKMNEQRATLIQNQMDTRNFILKLLVTEQFAEKWSAITAEKRKEYVLETIYKLAIQGPESEYNRSWCPEMTLDGVGTNPRSLIGLMLELANGDDGKFMEFPHPLVDLLLAKARMAEANNPIPEMTAYMAIPTSRTQTLTEFLFKICTAFSGRNEFNRPDPKTWKDEKKKVKEAQSISSEHKSLYKSLYRNKEGSGSNCWGCGVSEKELPAGSTLLVCSGCKKIGRKILYCSRECQKKDWSRAEDPFIPHKEVCGNLSRQANETRPHEPEIRAVATTQTFDMRALLAAIPRNTSATTSDSAPRPDFKASVTLKYQRYLMHKIKKADYTLFIPPLELAVWVPDDRLRDEFIQVRTRALENGDPASVKRMYEIMRPLVAQCAPVEYNLADQLKAEYGLEFPEYRGTQDNMKQMVEEMERHRSKVGFRS